MKKNRFLTILIVGLLSLAMACPLTFATTIGDEMVFDGRISTNGELPGYTGYFPAVVRVGAASTTQTGTTLTDITGTSIVIPSGRFSSGETAEWELVGVHKGFTTSTAHIMIYVKDAPMITSTFSVGATVGLATIQAPFTAKCSLTAVTSTVSMGGCQINTTATTTQFVIEPITATSNLATSTNQFTNAQKDMSAGGTLKIQMIQEVAGASTTVTFTRVKFNNN